MCIYYVYVIQTDRQTDRHTNIQTDTYIPTYIQTDSQTDIQTQHTRSFLNKLQFFKINL